MKTASLVLSIVFFVLHIAFAVLCGIYAVKNVDNWWMITSILWSVCVGLDIAELINKIVRG